MPTQRSLVLATAAVVGAGVVFTYTLARALTVEEGPAAAAPAARVSEKAATPAQPDAASKTPSTKTATAPERKTGIAREQLALAVENDPFQSDRMRPVDRYRMPGEELPEEPPPPEPPPPPPNFRVVGTIATPEGGVAVVETGDATRVVSIGESLSGFTLSRVTNRSATVEGNGRSYSLAIEEPSMRRAPSRGGRAGGRGPAQQQELQQRLREQIERLRQNGASSQMLEQMMQQLQGGGRGAFEFAPGALDVIRGSNGELQYILRPRGDTATVRVAPRVRRNNN